MTFCNLAVLLFLTGGIQNPFAMLIVVPVVVSAAAQKVREVLPLFVLAVVISILLVFFHYAASLVSAWRHGNAAAVEVWNMGRDRLDHGLYIGLHISRRQ